MSLEVDYVTGMFFLLQIHYDGWSTQFDVWCDSDLCDLHPVGWCQRTGHPLEPPPGQGDGSGGWEGETGQADGSEIAVVSVVSLLVLCPAGSPPLSSPSQGVCPTAGCRGVGHIKGARYTGHHR